MIIENMKKPLHKRVEPKVLEIRKFSCNSNSPTFVFHEIELSISKEQCKYFLPILDREKIPELMGLADEMRRVLSYEPIEEGFVKITYSDPRE